MCRKKSDSARASSISSSSCPAFPPRTSCWMRWPTPDSFHLLVGGSELLQLQMKSLQAATENHPVRLGTHDWSCPQTRPKFNHSWSRCTARLGLIKVFEAHTLIAAVMLKYTWGALGKQGAFWQGFYFWQLSRSCGMDRMVAEACKVITIPAPLKSLFISGKFLLTCSLCQCLLFKPMEFFYLISVKLLQLLSTH